MSRCKLLYVFLTHLLNIFWEGIPVRIKRAGLPLCHFDPFVAYDASVYIVQIRGRNEENFGALT